VLLPDRKRPVHGSLAKFLDRLSTRCGRLSKADSASSFRVKTSSRQHNSRRKLRLPKSPTANLSDPSRITVRSLPIRILALYLERNLLPISMEEEELLPISCTVSLLCALVLRLLQYLLLTLRPSRVSLFTLLAHPRSNELPSKRITLVLPPSALSLATISILPLLLPGNPTLRQLPPVPKSKKRMASPILLANRWRLPRDRNHNLHRQKIDSPKMLPALSLRWHSTLPPSRRRPARIARCNPRIHHIEE